MYLRHFIAKEMGWYWDLIVMRVTILVLFNVNNAYANELLSFEAVYDRLNGRAFQ